MVRYIIITSLLITFYKIDTYLTTMQGIRIIHTLSHYLILITYSDFSESNELYYYKNIQVI